MDYLFGFFISTLVCWALIPILISYAPQLGLLDAPGERKIHISAIPRCGGVGIVAGAVLAVVILLPFNTHYYSLVVGGLIITLFGIIDDVFEINYKWKFLGQFLAVCYVISQGVYIKIIPFMGLDEAPLFISYILTVLFVIGVTNAVNLSDGLDGLAAGIMLLSLSCIAFFSYFSGNSEVGLMALAVMGGIIGFLRFNTHPAIIFMGDTGSQFIGFMAAFLVILLTQNVSTAFNPALPLLIMGLPILDTISVMTQRIRVGRSPFSPDKRHIHHKLLVYGFTHEEAVAAIYLLQALFLISAFCLRYAADWEVVGIYLAISVLILAAFYFAGLKQWVLHTAGAGAGAGAGDCKRKNVLRNYRWLFSFCRKYIEYSIVFYMASLVACLLYFSKPEWYLEAVLVVLSFCLFKWTSFSIQKFLIRIGIYSSVLFSCYALSKLSDVYKAIFDFVDIFFVLLLVVITIAIRITRKVYFKLTTQDLLVVLFVLSATFFIETDYFIRTILYLSCLGYWLEYLFHRDAYMFRLLRILALFSMLNFGVFLSVIY